FALGRFDDALRLYRKALTRSPTSTVYLWNAACLAFIYYHKDASKIDLREEFLDRLFDADPGLHSTLTRWAETAIVDGRPSFELIRGLRWQL
ncbi:MAG: hypothetical protein AAFN74_19920, partial [Myxococcota bacterium]